MPSHKAKPLIVPTLLRIKTQSFGGIEGPTNSLPIFTSSLPDNSHMNKCVQTGFCARKAVPQCHTQGWSPVQPWEPRKCSVMASDCRLAVTFCLMILPCDCPACPSSVAS